MSLALDLSPFPVLHTASGVLLAAFGVWILTLRPRRRSNVWLALFAISYAFAFLTPPAILFQNPEIRAALYPLGWLFYALGIVAFAGIATTIPRPLGSEERRLLIPAATLAALYLAVAVVSVALAPEAQQQALFPGLPQWIQLVEAPAFRTFSAAAWFVALLLPLRARIAARVSTSAERAQFRLVAAALLLYPAMIAGADLRAAAAGTLPAVRGPVGLFGLLLLTLLAALWFRAGAAADSRESRNLGLAGLALALAAAIVSGTTPGVVGSAVCIATVLVLAYAILRHQLLGIDVKVKWTISRGTLAAIFVAVFFVAAQIAQNYLQQYGVLLGGIIAGLLLFALAPLQRLAERVADAAMPGVKPLSQLDEDERIRIYREQARVAWADGSLTSEERELLDVAREQLGIPHEEASRIERHVRAGVLSAKPQ